MPTRATSSARWRASHLPCCASRWEWKTSRTSLRTWITHWADNLVTPGEAYLHDYLRSLVWIASAIHTSWPIERHLVAQLVGRSMKFPHLHLILPLLPRFSKRKISEEMR